MAIEFIRGLESAGDRVYVVGSSRELGKLAIDGKRVRTFTVVAVAVSMVLVTILAEPVEAQGEEKSLGVSTELRHAQDGVLVKLAPGASPRATLGPGSAKVFDRWRRVPVPPGLTAAQVVEQLSKRPGVEVAELDYEVQLDPWNPAPLSHEPAVVADDPFLSLQWNFPAAMVEEAWGQSTGLGVTVAVLDSGVALDGEDLTCRNFVAPYNAITQKKGITAARDDHGHGTHVTGTVAQCTNNGVGVAGVAYDVDIMPVKVLDSSGVGAFSWIARGMDWAVSNGAEVINMSLGCSGCSSSVLDDAIQAADAEGVVVVAASGNDGLTKVSYPASHPSVIAVGATDYRDVRAPYSNSGSALDLVAPGGDLNQDANNDGFGDGVLQETFKQGMGWNYYFYNGTSMASPHVAGAAALILSLAPGLSPGSVQDILESTSIDLGPSGPDTLYGHGLLQVHDALEYLTTGDESPPTWPQGARLSVSDVTGKSARLHWPAATDNRGVSGYELSRNGELLRTVRGGTTSTVVTGLTPVTGYNFSVRPKDPAGNLGKSLNIGFVTADTVAPVWGSGAAISVDVYGETSLTLSWTTATDNVSVDSYWLRLANTTGRRVSRPTANVTGLPDGTSHLFEVFAIDEAGNWSEALEGTVRTATSFIDTRGHTFEQDIVWMSGADVTRGCNPPVNDRFCPDDPVTRAQMAAFLVRGLGLVSDDHPGFVDVASSSTFVGDIRRLAAAGVTVGCNPPVNDRFCPDELVTRGQLAAFLNRALN